MFQRLQALRKRLRLGSLQRRDFTSAEEQPVENTDAMAAAGLHGHSDPSGSGVSGYPPGYVKSYDEGRPRH